MAEKRYRGAWTPNIAESSKSQTDFLMTSHNSVVEENSKEEPLPAVIGTRIGGNHSVNVTATPLITLLWERKVTEALELIRRDPDVIFDRENICKLPAIVVAAGIKDNTSNALKVVKQMLKNNVGVDSCCVHRHASLREAACAGNEDILYFLLSKGANINLQTTQGDTPLYTAAEMGHPSIVKILLSKNADPHLSMLNRSTPLIVASQKGFGEIVNSLLQYDANIDSQTDKGTTPLITAVEFNQLEVVRLLIAANASLTLSKPGNITPLFVAVAYNKIEMATLLIQGGSAIDVFSDKAGTPLFVAAQKGYLNVVKLLLQYGANPNYLWRNCTPIKMAESGGHLDVVRELRYHLSKSVCSFKHLENGLRPGWSKKTDNNKILVKNNNTNTGWAPLIPWDL